MLNFSYGILPHLHEKCRSIYSINSLSHSTSRQLTNKLEYYAVYGIYLCLSYCHYVPKMHNTIFGQNKIFADRWKLLLGKSPWIWAFRVQLRRFSLVVLCPFIIKGHFDTIFQVFSRIRQDHLEYSIQNDFDDSWKIEQGKFVLLSFKRRR